MSFILTGLLITAMLAVLVSLSLGLAGMVKKNVSDEKQNRLMQARVGFQFLALILIGLVLVFK